MLKTITAALVALSLSGCAIGENLVEQVPSARYCHEVQYQRSGQDVVLAMACTVPWGQPAPSSVGGL